MSTSSNGPTLVASTGSVHAHTNGFSHHQQSQPQQPQQQRHQLATNTIQATQEDLGVSIGLSHLYEPFPLDIRQTKCRGRIVVATRDIAAGETLLRSTHYTTSVCDEFKSIVCSGCFSPNIKSLQLKCAHCNEVFYCNAQCEAQAEHFADECAALQKLHTLPRSSFTPDQWSEIRMIVKMTAKYVIEKATGQPQQQKTQTLLNPALNPRDKIHSALWSDVCRLVPNRETFSESVQADVNRMSRFVLASMPSVGGLQLSDIEDTFYRERCNCFGIWDSDDRCLGAALYPTASFFNHSCIPNSSRYVDVNGVVSIKALYPIPANTEITIAYIDVKNRPTKSRVDELKGYYLFECCCPRCMDPTPASDEFIHKFICKREGCTGMMVAAEGRSSKVLRCRTCPFTEPFDYDTHFPSGFVLPHQMQ